MKIQKKRLLIYYIAVPFVLCAASAFLLTVLNMITQTDLGMAILMTYAFLYLLFPAVCILLLRFSVLPWVIDPFASFEITLTFVLALFADSWAKRGFKGAVGDFFSQKMSGLFVYALVLFIFCIICSLSFERKEGIFLIDKLFKKPPESGEAEN